MSPIDERDSRRLLERHQAALLELARFDGPHADDQGLALRILLDVTARTLGVERTSVWTFDKDRTVISCVLLFEQSTKTYSSGHQLFASVVPSYFAELNENRALASHDAQNDPVMVEIAPIYLAPLGIVSMLDAPIRMGGHMTGIVCNEHTGVPRVWTADEQNFAASISDMAAVILEHSDRMRAEAEVQRRDEMLEGVAKAANRMFANAERDIAFQEALMQAVVDVATVVADGARDVGAALAVIGAALDARAVGLYVDAGAHPSARAQIARTVWARDNASAELVIDAGASLPERWYEALRAGESVGGPVESLSPLHAAQFERRGAGSVLLAPSGSTGLLEVDAAAGDREWTRGELLFARACALLVGAM